MTAGDLTGFDEVVLATGVAPRGRASPGSTTRRCVATSTSSRHGKPVGERVAVIGAGGIGFDVAEFLTHTRLAGARPRRVAGRVGRHRPGTGARAALAERRSPSRRRGRCTCCSARRPGVGAGLGKTTGLDPPRRAQAPRRRACSPASTYERIDDAGLHITVDGEPRLLDVDTVVLCAGQEPGATSPTSCAPPGCTVHLIGGADVAAELDAKRAIDQGTRLAAAL